MTARAAMLVACGVLDVDARGVPLKERVCGAWRAAPRRLTLWERAALAMPSWIVSMGGAS